MMTTRNCLFISALLLFAQFTSAQSLEDVRITADYRDTPLKQIFQEWDVQYDVDIYFRDRWLPAENISASFEDEPIQTALAQLLQETSLNFATYRDFAVIIAPENVLSQQFTQEFYLKQRNERLEAMRRQADFEQNMKVLGDTAVQTTPETAVIQGLIKDQVSGELLSGTTLYIPSLDKSASSDENGRYRLEAPTGYYELEVRYVGYETLQQNIQLAGNDIWNIDLLPDALELNEIIINEKNDDSNVRSVQMGIARLSPQQIKEVPAFLGEVDVVRSLLTLPGVATVGEGASGFNVRGGNIDQNLIMQDGALLFNSSHVLGLFSVFNPDALQDVTLYKGNIPAQYGGRLSSVLDVKLRNGNFQELKGEGGVGIIASRLLLEGPLVQDKTSFLVAARSSYSDWVLRLLEDPDLNQSSAFFYDVNAKLTHRFGEGSSLNLAFYQSFDNFRYSDEFGYSWGTRTASLRWNQIIGPQLSSTTSLFYGDNNNASYEPEGISAFELTNGLTYYKLRQDFFWSPSPAHNLQLGAEGTRYLGKDEELTGRGGISEIIPERLDKDKGQEVALYINDEFELGSRLAFSLGLRYSFFQQIGPDQQYIYREGAVRSPANITDSVSYGNGDIIQTYSGLEPRLSMKISLGSANSIKLSYNRLYQYIHLISNTTAAVPADLWQVSNRYIAPQISDNYSLGYFHNFRNNRWETSVEAFYRDLQNIVEYKDLPELFLNQYLETELLSGTGQAYGAELLIKRNAVIMSGQLSYTYSRSLSQVAGPNSEESINQGNWFPSNFDQPHNLNMTMNLRLSRRSKLGMNFVYSTGRPITAPIAYYFLDQTYVPHYSDRNQFRIPDYHRLDLSYTVETNRLRRKEFRGSLTFSIYNLYGRKNAFSVFFRRDPGSASNAYKLAVLGSIFPAITYNFEF